MAQYDSYRLTHFLMIPIWIKLCCQAMWTIDTWDFGKLNFLINLNLFIYLFDDTYAKLFVPWLNLNRPSIFFRDSTVDKILVTRKLSKVIRNAMFVDCVLIKSKYYDVVVCSCLAEQTVERLLQRAWDAIVVIIISLPLSRLPQANQIFY